MVILIFDIVISILVITWITLSLICLVLKIQIDREKQMIIALSSDLKMEELELKIAELEHNNISLENDLEDFKDLNKLAKDKYNEAFDECLRLQDESDKWQKECERLYESINCLEFDLHNECENYITLRHEHQALQRDLRVTEDDYNQMEKMYYELENEYYNYECACCSNKAK